MVLCCTIIVKMRTKVPASGFLHLGSLTTLNIVQ